MFIVLFVFIWLLFILLLSFQVMIPWLFPVWIIAGFIVALVTQFLILIILTPIMKKISYQSKFKAYIVRSAAAFINMISRVKVTKVVGLENIPKDGKLVIYGNHKSQIDPFIVLEIMSRPLAFTPKKSLYKIPFLKQYMDAVGCFPIDRESDRNTARELVKAIKRTKEGLAIMVFPEGGIKDRDDDTMKEMRAGAYQIALKSEATILPLTIIGNANIHKRAPFRKTKVQLVIHEPIYYEEYKNKTTFQLAEEVLEVINSGFQTEFN